MQKYHIIKTEEYTRLLDEEINNPATIYRLQEKARATAFELTYNIRKKECEETNAKK